MSNTPDNRTFERAQLEELEARITQMAAEIESLNKAVIHLARMLGPTAKIVALQEIWKEAR